MLTTTFPENVAVTLMSQTATNIGGGRVLGLHKGIPPLSAKAAGKIKENKIVEYRANVKLSFVVE
jgi:hypothetical protein